MFGNPEIIGLDRTLAHLERIGEIPAAMGGTMKEAVLYVHSQVPPYPAPPVGSTYRRTGTLGRTVTTMQGSEPSALSRVEVSALGGNVVGIIGTRLDYGPEVISEGEQIRVHAGRWWTLQGTIKNAWGGIVDIFRKMVHGKVEG